MRRSPHLRSLLVRLILCFNISALGVTCGNDQPTVTGPSAGADITFTQQSPPSGSTIIVGNGNPPGAFILRGSGQLTVGLTISAVHTVPWAQLRVYLLTATGYCGQNLPDSPVWAPLEAGERIDYAVTGFQVFSLPCDVVGLRALLDTRGDINTGSPPAAGLAAADMTLPYNLALRR